MAVEAYGKENRQEAKKPSRPPHPHTHTPSQLQPYTCLLTLEPSRPDHFPFSVGVITEPSVWWWPAPMPFLTPVLEPTSTWRCSTTVSLTVSHLVPHAVSGPSPTEQGRNTLI